MNKIELMDSIRQEAEDTGSIGPGQEKVYPNTIGEQTENLPEQIGEAEENSFEQIGKTEENSLEQSEEAEENVSDTINEQIENFSSNLEKAVDYLISNTDEKSSGEENSGVEKNADVESSVMDETELSTEIGVWEKISNTVGFPTLWIAGGVTVLVLVVLGVWMFVRARRKKKMIKPTPTQPIQGQQYQGQASRNGDASTSSVGKLHNIGRRKNQQDSFGVMPIAGGQFAVVADGMGGLSEGDKVSQQIVMLMLQDASGFGSGPKDRVLFELVSHANREVNRMLGVSDQYVSGSTVVAALVENGCFHWVSVGDSRIYLYRNQRLVQLNREHTYEAELLIQAVNGEIPFEDVRTHPKRGGLTSFIGMGELKYIDGSSRGIRIQKGDRLLLMTDGVFNTLSEEEICGIVQSAGCAENIAAAMQERILSYGRDKQDNFTAVILDL